MIPLILFESRQTCSRSFIYVPTLFYGPSFLGDLDLLSTFVFGAETLRPRANPIKEF